MNHRPSFVKNPWNKYFIVCAFLLVFLWLVHPKPYIASDPGVYSYNAYKISSGTFFTQPSAGHFAQRLGVTVPVAVLYKYFGINAVTTHLYNLIVTILTLTVIWSLCEGRVKYFAGMLFALALQQYQCTVELLPDAIESGFLMLSTFFLVKRLNVLKPGWHFHYPLLAVLCVVLAFLAKETAYWIIPVWGAVLVRDLYLKRYGLLSRFYLPSLVYVLLLAILYLMICKKIWGDPYARLTQLFKWGDSVQDQAWAWSHQSGARLLFRLSVEPLLQLARDYTSVFALSIGGAILFAQKLKFWIFYFFCFLLFYWFGSTSLTHYEPLYAHSRYILAALPSMCIISGYFLDALVSKSVGPWRNAVVKISLVLPLLILCLPFLAKPGGSVSWIAWVSAILLACLYLFSFGIIRPRPAVIHMWIIVLLSLPVANYFRFIVRHDLNAEKKCITVLQEIIRRKDHPYLLLCYDPRSPFSLSYYFSYRYPDNLTVRYLVDVKPEEKRESHVLYFLHSIRSGLAKNRHGSDFEVSKIPPNNILFAKEGIYLFERTGNEFYP